MKIETKELYFVFKDNDIDSCWSNMSEAIVRKDFLKEIKELEEQNGNN